MNKAQALKYLIETELDIQSANAAILAVDLAYDSYANSSWVHKEVFSPIFCYVSYKSLVSHFQFISKERIHNLGKRIYSDYKKNPESLLKKISEHKNQPKQFNKIWKQYKNKDLSDKELLKIYRDILKISKKIWAYCSVGEDKGHIIDLKIVPNFMKRHNLSEDKARKIVNELSYPKEKTIFNQERIEFLKICISSNEKKIKDYIKKFFWINTTFYKAEEMTIGSVERDIKKELKKHTIKQIKKEIEKLEHNFSKLNRRENPIKLSKEDKDDLKFAENIVYWHDQRKLSMVTQLYYSLLFLKDLSKRYDIPYERIATYNYDEIEKLIKTGKKLSDNIIDKKFDGMFMIFEKGKRIKTILGKDAKELFEAGNQVLEKEIKGIVASKGKTKKVKGKIKIVISPTKNKFNNGEILVTYMTRIEFVPLMRKAKAIITNEGGIACHASIVSRELEIPCIIGTKNATRLLKDGDEVEMDMQSGKIKKIL